MIRKRLFIRELECLEPIVDKHLTLQGAGVKVNSYTGAYAQGSFFAATRGRFNVTVQPEGGKANSYASAYAKGSTLSQATANSRISIRVDSE